MFLGSTLLGFGVYVSGRWVYVDAMLLLGWVFVCGSFVLGFWFYCGFSFCFDFR